MSSQTYFYALELLMINNKVDGNIEKNISITIPLVITAFDDNSEKNPLPDVTVNLKSRYFIWDDEVIGNVIMKNKSRTYIVFGSEVIFLNGNNEKIYSEKIEAPSDRLLPDQGIEKLIKTRIRQSSLPYIGNIKIIIRTTVNGERYLETNPITIFILPKEFIIAMIILIIMALLASRQIYIKRLNDKSKKLREAQ
jgi:hypothetical protein